MIDQPKMSEKWRIREKLSGFNSAVDRVAVATLKKGSPPTKKLVREMIFALGDEIWRSVRETGRFHWPRLGVFSLSKHKARRAFRIGQKAGGQDGIYIPARWRLTFRASSLKKGVGDDPS